MSHDEDSNGLVVLTDNIVQEKENSNTNKKLFSCQVCDMKFTRQDVLNSHERIHTNKKPFICKHCDKKFKFSHTSGHNFGKVGFVEFGPANWKSNGNVHRVSTWVFSVSSYMLVLSYK